MARTATNRSQPVVVRGSPSVRHVLSSGPFWVRLAAPGVGLGAIYYLLHGDIRFDIRLDIRTFTRRYTKNIRHIYDLKKIDGRKNFFSRPPELKGGLPFPEFVGVPLKPLFVGYR